MIITKNDYIEMKVTMDQQATIEDFVNAIKQATTEISIDYYEELKAKADFYDALMKFTKTGDARVSLTDKASNEVMPFLSRIKETKNV